MPQGKIQSELPPYKVHSVWGINSSSLENKLENKINHHIGNVEEDLSRAESWIGMSVSGQPKVLLTFHLVFPPSKELLLLSALKLLLASSSLSLFTSLFFFHFFTAVNQSREKGKKGYPRKRERKGEREAKKAHYYCWLPDPPNPLKFLMLFPSSLFITLKIKCHTITVNATVDFTDLGE